ncbi:hypothetical protein [Pusillimonas sp. NJUB218]|uniref:hypothetical protein n=1 Tax=Pusillimonas sp. NJUB218 TaxID=2023230 RepID=UPI000F4BB17B|nr:hypothetical protein [Pusillimonas sp. NJUB218]ROT45033.1 hypothetical protein CHR62_09280 [Pusillimonas sp. NJUB218]
MKKVVIATLALALAGCATKNYGRQGELTSYEKETMTCREIALEEAKVMGFLEHVNKESEFDGRSVLSFLGDFGIGNLMEKDNAVKSANTRLAQLKEVSTQKKCGQGASL